MSSILTRGSTKPLVGGGPGLTLRVVLEIYPASIQWVICTGCVDQPDGGDWLSVC